MEVHRPTIRRVRAHIPRKKKKKTSIHVSYIYDDKSKRTQIK